MVLHDQILGFSPRAECLSKSGKQDPGSSTIRSRNTTQTLHILTISCGGNRCRWMWSEPPASFASHAISLAAATVQPMKWSTNSATSKPVKCLYKTSCSIKSQYVTCSLSAFKLLIYLCLLSHLWQPPHHQINCLLFRQTFTNASSWVFPTSVVELSRKSSIQYL